MILVVAEEDLTARLSRDFAQLARECRAMSVAELHEDPARWHSLLSGSEALVLDVSRHSLTAALVSACDTAGVRIVPLARGEAAKDLARSFGLAESFPRETAGSEIILALGRAPEQGARREDGIVIAVWGAHGSPGRSTIARELAHGLAARDHGVVLVDADTVAPSQALALGIPDEGPGFAAACRQAERGELTAAELERISIEAAGRGVPFAVLSGLNRPSRWPELSGPRVREALRLCREWKAFTIVDVAASIEQDEEIVSDVDGPRRNASGLAVLEAADHIVAVSSADAIGIARFLRGYAEIKELVPATAMTVVVNRARGSASGFDARTQIATTLRRFAGIDHVLFLPDDRRSTDAALLHATTVSARHPRRPLAVALDRIARSFAPPAAEEGVLLRRDRKRQRRGEDERTRAMRRKRGPMRTGSAERLVAEAVDRTPAEGVRLASPGARALRRRPEAGVTGVPVRDTGSSPGTQ